MDNQKDQKGKAIRQENVQVPETSFNILYSDAAFATSSATGFVLDFGQKTPQLSLIRLVSRVGMSPVHFKMFVQMLNRQLHGYEAKFGGITISPKAQSEMDKIMEELKNKRKES